ncbi:MAG: D-alanyl-D-alanine carboxypeptidase family protein [Verrucomicrobiaceae bacterium]|nr:D-alanyl-D-alanine carboxypeptidase family protein [Verrucomicrobiaceae bacterium]
MPEDPNRRITDTSVLHPVVRQKVAQVLAQLEAEGIPLRVFESYRTPTRQAHLYAQGRTRSGNKVTNAEAWESYHQYGLAVDLVFFENGEWHWGKNQQHSRMYDRMHQIARSAGLEPLSWETPHIQLMGVTISTLMQGRFPSGGDSGWADNLRHYAETWNSNPAAPPLQGLGSLHEPQRPPLTEEFRPALPVGAHAPVSVIPATYDRKLNSRLFAGKPALESVASGHRVLKVSGSRVEGIEFVQDGLNLLAGSHPEYAIDVGQFRGFFGQRTERAVEAFQEDYRLIVDGVVGEETVLALDDAVALAEGTPAGSLAPISSSVSASSYTPPSSNAALLQKVRFDKADATVGKTLADTYAAADKDPRLAKGDPSNCKALLKFADGTVFFEAKMAICADGSPRAKEIDPGPGNPKTAFTYPGMAGAYFDAEDVPYIVLPGKNDSGTLDFVKTMGLSKLDLAVVIHRGRLIPAFYGEVGPVFRIGEAAIQVHEDLPVRSPWTSPAKAKVRNASVEGEVLYFVFPGTAVPKTAGMSKEQWLDKVKSTALQKWEAFLAAQ